MNFFPSRGRRVRHKADLAAVPAGGGNAAAPARFADPVAQAMSTGDRRSADVVWIGGVTFRAER
jgi:hypothetical protein